MLLDGIANNVCECSPALFSQKIPLSTGTILGDGYLDSRDQPLHSVTLDAYYIDKYEVTNAQYAQCEAAGECYPQDRNSSYARTSYNNNPIYADYSVLIVNWYKARDYCAWADQRNQQRATVDCQFTNTKARSKLEYLYPSIS